MIPDAFYKEISEITKQKFKKLIQENDYDEAALEYNAFYNEIVKSYESKTHYERCFNIINPFFKEIINKNIKARKSNKNDLTQKNIYIFIPNISSNRAHIDFIFEILKYHDKSFSISIVYIDSNKNINNKIQNLVIEKKINLKKIDGLDISTFEKFFNKHNDNIDLFILYATPLMIPYFCKVLNDRFIYLSLKFEYSCFEELKKGITFNGEKLSSRKEKNTFWNLIPPKSIDLEYPKFTKKLDSNEIKFLTVNRVEKILDFNFLNMVKKLLNEYPTSHFYWAAQNENILIKDFFKKNFLAHRSHFLGWVNPNEIMNNYDIYLDSFLLSGVVAQNFFSAGMPVITMKNSLSYIDIYNNYILSKTKKRFVADDMNEYINMIKQIISSEEFRLDLTKLQRKISSIFIDNHISMYLNFKKVLLNDSF